MIGTHMMTERRRRDEVVVRLERPGRTVVALTSMQIANFAGNALELQGRRRTAHPRAVDHKFSVCSMRKRSYHVEFNHVSVRLRVGATHKDAGTLPFLRPRRTPVSGSLSCFPEPPFTGPRGGSGKQARSCFLVGPAVWSHGRTITSAAWSGRAIVTRMGGDARLARGSGARPKPGRALERDPSLEGEGAAPNGERRARSCCAECLHPT